MAITSRILGDGITAPAQGNTNPNNLSLKTTVKLKAKNTTNNTELSESFNVVPPSYIIPIPGSSGKYMADIGGGYIVKFTMPQASFVDANLNTFVGKDTMYVTYAKKSSLYVDGYEDFTTSVPADYISKLSTWLYNQKFAGSTVQTLGSSSFDIMFNATTVSNAINTSITFGVTFKFMIGATQPAVISTTR